MTLINGGGHEHVDSIVGNGGSIYCQSGYINATECGFMNNKLQVDTISDQGGTNTRGTSGGAIYMSSGTGEFTFCLFSNNSITGIALDDSGWSYTGGSGGAIYASGSDLHFNQCLLQQNAAGSGGAVYNNSTGNIYVENSIFRNNQATTFVDDSLEIVSPGLGGAVYITTSTSTRTIEYFVNQSSFLNNMATNGGAFYLSSGTGDAHSFVNLNNSTVANNTAEFLPDSNNARSGDGGGFYLTAGTGDAISKLTLWNSTLSGNMADGGNGGAYYGRTSTGSAKVQLYMHYSTVTDNHAESVSYNSSTYGGNCGGILSDDGISSSEAFMLFENSIIAGNQAITNPDGCELDGGTDTTAGFNIIGVADGFTLTPNTEDNFGTLANPFDAGLDTLQWYGGPTMVHPLLVGSAAIDGGDPGSAVTFDQRGEVRPFNTFVDKGAVEYQGVDGPCLANANFDVPDVCAGSGTSFAATFPTAANYEWRTGGVVVGVTQNLDHTFTEAGPNSIMLIAIDGSCRDTVEKYFTVLPDLYAETIQSTNGAFVNPEFLGMDSCSTVLSTTLGMCGYAWYLGNTMVSNDVSYTATQPGEYTLVLTNCCGVSDTLPLTIFNPDLVLDILGDGSSDTTITDSIILDAGTFNSYTWSTGATTATITVDTTGTYSVTVTNAAGCTTEQTVTVTKAITPGIAGIDAATFNLYPNPASGMVFIQANGTFGEIELELADFTGKRHIQEQYTLQSGSAIQLDVSTLSAGIYFVRLSHEGQQITKKLVLTK